MDFGAKKKHVVELILETFILMLIVNGTETHGKNVMSWEILIRSIIAQIIIMSVLIK